MTTRDDIIERGRAAWERDMAPLIESAKRARLERRRKRDRGETVETIDSDRTEYRLAERCCDPRIIDALLSMAGERVADAPVTETVRGSYRTPPTSIRFASIDGGRIIAKPAVRAVHRDDGSARWVAGRCVDFELTYEWELPTMSGAEKRLVGGKALKCRISDVFPRLSARRWWRNMEMTHYAVGAILLSLDELARGNLSLIASPGRTHCGICGRGLTDELSLQRGIGPECRRLFDHLAQVLVFDRTGPTD